MNIKRNLVTLILTAASFAMMSSTVSAATWETCEGRNQTWRSDRADMYLSTISMPIGSQWDLHTQYMMSEWNAVNKSNFKFQVGRDTDGTVNSSNGRNEIYFKDRPSETYLGVTYIRTSCYWLFGWKYGYKEADIEMNLRYDWTVGNFTGSVTSSPYSFPLVMLHELGHALGLDHSDGQIATMNTYYYNGGPVGHYNKVEPHGDDRHGLRILYPDSTSGRDIAASRFQNTGGGASAINKVTTTSGSLTGNLKKGSSYKMKYTVENLGTQTETVGVKFYISTNSLISTGDIYVGGVSLNMAAGGHATFDKTFTVPTSLSTGFYYVGYRVDPNNAISETDESNNYVSLLDRVYIYQ